jgi:hypothetical protein
MKRTINHLLLASLLAVALAGCGKKEALPESKPEVKRDENIVILKKRICSIWNSSWNRCNLAVLA